MEAGAEGGPCCGLEKAGASCACTQPDVSMRLQPLTAGQGHTMVGEVRFAAYASAWGIHHPFDMAATGEEGSRLGSEDEAVQDAALYNMT